MFEPHTPANTPRIWQVGALCRAIADALDARFNPVRVQGEITGFSRAPSGHCYFTLKDVNGQIRCAMFRRAASLLDFTPRDGELIEAKGRLDVYGPRGDLQLIVESVSRGGAGTLFEQFLKLKAKLQAEGLFDAERKRPLPTMPRGIGVVTSLGAAALHDVATVLQRRVPHIPVVLAPALVQGAGAAVEIQVALSKLYLLSGEQYPPAVGGNPIHIDVILLVRGGGAMDDLAAFNDEALARVIAQSPVPLVTGIGHETDFTIADFCADLRAPTPTAAAELAALPTSAFSDLLNSTRDRLQAALHRRIDVRHQRLDAAASRLGRPSELSASARITLATRAQQISSSVQHFVQRKQQHLKVMAAAHPQSVKTGLARRIERLDRLSLRLGLLDPSLVLQRGYAWLEDAQRHTVTSVRQAYPGQALKATLADGTMEVTVASVATTPTANPTATPTANPS